MSKSDTQSTPPAHIHVYYMYVTCIPRPPTHTYMHTKGRESVQLTSTCSFAGRQAGKECHRYNPRPDCMLLPRPCNCSRANNGRLESELYVRTYIHTYIHTYLHTYIPTYLHTHIHTYLWCDRTVKENNQCTGSRVTSTRAIHPSIEHF